MVAWVEGVSSVELSDEEVAALSVQAINGDIEARNLLVESYIKAVVKFVNKYASDDDLRDEALSESLLKLIRVIERKPMTRRDFRYIEVMVRTTVYTLRKGKSSIWLSSRVFNLAKKYEHCGCIEEIKNEIRGKVRKVNEVSKLIYQAALVLQGGSDKDIRYIEDRNFEVTSQSVKKHCLAEVDEVLDQLPSPHKEYIDMRYGIRRNPVPRKKIGSILGVKGMDLQVMSAKASLMLRKILNPDNPRRTVQNLFLNCMICGNEFQASTSVQKTCSKKCATEKNRIRKLATRKEKRAAAKRNQVDNGDLVVERRIRLEDLPRLAEVQGA